MAKKKVTPAAKLKIDVYQVISRAVEEGVGLGWRRAHKHTVRPTEESAIEAIVAAVMTSLDEVVRWE